MPLQCRSEFSAVFLGLNSCSNVSRNTLLISHGSALELVKTSSWSSVRTAGPCLLYFGPRMWKSQIICKNKALHKRSQFHISSLKTFPETDVKTKAWSWNEPKHVKFTPNTCTDFKTFGSDCYGLSCSSSNLKQHRTWLFWCISLFLAFLQQFTGVDPRLRAAVNVEVSRNLAMSLQQCHLSLQVAPNLHCSISLLFGL